MDSLRAFALGQANRGKEMMVFDWDKAVKIIKERGLKKCAAGLSSDFKWTAGLILVDGMPYDQDCTFLASTWATPQLIVCDDDGDYIQEIDCYIMESETNYSSDTKFPMHLRELFENKGA